MDNSETFRQAGKPGGATLADVIRALEELGVRLEPEDQKKVADNIALLGRHWQVVTGYPGPDRNER